MKEASPGEHLSKLTVKCCAVCCKFRGKCSKYTPHRKACGAVGTRTELHSFQSFLTGGAEGTFNPHPLPYPPHPLQTQYGRRHVQQKPPVTLQTFPLQHQGGLSSALQRATGCFTKHKRAGFLGGCFGGGGGGGQRVGIDGEALFMHPPCSSKKSVSFSLVRPSVSLTGTPFL